MRERPILFSAPMVRALLDGTKTQTRRLVKAVGIVVDCPYGFVGDRLWVREAWRTDAAFDEMSGSEIEHAALIHHLDPAPTPIRYEADGTVREVDGVTMIKAGRYRHARFMPRWASRTLLEITDVRLQRLQSISEGDARAEGALHRRTVFEAGGATTTDDVPDARLAFSRLWDDINGAGAWDANPWVWALTFKRVDEVRRA